MIKTFYFKDRRYSGGYYSRVTIIKLNSICIVLYYNADHGYELYLYKNDKYVAEYDVSDKFAETLIKESKEYQDYLYESKLV